jgi:hypothetical protein
MATAESFGFSHGKLSMAARICCGETFTARR